MILLLNIIKKKQLIEQLKSKLADIKNNYINIIKLIDSKNIVDIKKLFDEYENIKDIEYNRDKEIKRSKGGDGSKGDRGNMSKNCDNINIKLRELLQFFNDSIKNIRDDSNVLENILSNINITINSKYDNVSDYIEKNISITFFKLLFKCYLYILSIPHKCRENNENLISITLDKLGHLIIFHKNKDAKITDYEKQIFNEIDKNLQYDVFSNFKEDALNQLVIDLKKLESKNVKQLAELENTTTEFNILITKQKEVILNKLKIINEKIYSIKNFLMNKGIFVFDKMESITILTNTNISIRNVDDISSAIDFENEYFENTMKNIDIIFGNLNKQINNLRQSINNKKNFNIKFTKFMKKNTIIEFIPLEINLKKRKL